MFKLKSIVHNNPQVIEVIPFLIRYRELLFTENQNPVSVFLKDLETGKIKVIGAFYEDKLFAFIALYDFKEIAKGKFICYMYGAAERNVANLIDKGFEVIFESLKSQGCVALRLETRKFNLPMRICARRSGFRKVGILSNAAYLHGKFVDNILYEKRFT